MNALPKRVAQTYLKAQEGFQLLLAREPRPSQKGNTAILALSTALQDVNRYQQPTHGLIDLVFLMNIFDSAVNGDLQLVDPLTQEYIRILLAMAPAVIMASYTQGVTTKNIVIERMAYILLSAFNSFGQNSHNVLVGIFATHIIPEMPDRGVAIVPALLSSIVPYITEMSENFTQLFRVIVESRPDLHIFLLEMIAYGPLEKRRDFAQLFFSLHPPQNNFQNMLGTPIAEAWAGTPESALVQQAVLSMCLSGDPDLGELAIQLIQKKCDPRTMPPEKEKELGAIVAASLYMLNTDVPMPGTQQAAAANPMMNFPMMMDANGNPMATMMMPGSPMGAGMGAPSSPMGMGMGMMTPSSPMQYGGSMSMQSPLPPITFDPSSYDPFNSPSLDSLSAPRPPSIELVQFLEKVSEANFNVFCQSLLPNPPQHMRIGSLWNADLKSFNIEELTRSRQKRLLERVLYMSTLDKFKRSCDLVMPYFFEELSQLPPSMGSEASMTFEFIHREIEIPFAAPMHSSIAEVFKKLIDSNAKYHKEIDGGTLSSEFDVVINQFKPIHALPAPSLSLDAPSSSSSSMSKPTRLLSPKATSEELPIFMPNLLSQRRGFRWLHLFVDVGLEIPLKSLIEIAADMLSTDERNCPLSHLCAVLRIILRQIRRAENSASSASSSSSSGPSAPSSASFFAPSSSAPEQKPQRKYTFEELRSFLCILSTMYQGVEKEIKAAAEPMTEAFERFMNLCCDLLSYACGTRMGEDQIPYTEAAAPSPPPSEEPAAPAAPAADGSMPFPSSADPLQQQQQPVPLDPLQPQPMQPAMPSSPIPSSIASFAQPGQQLAPVAPMMMPPSTPGLSAVPMNMPPGTTMMMAPVMTPNGVVMMAFPGMVDPSQQVKEQKPPETVTLDIQLPFILRLLHIMQKRPTVNLTRLAAACISALCAEKTLVSNRIDFITDIQLAMLPCFWQLLSSTYSKVNEYAYRLIQRGVMVDKQPFLTLLYDQFESDDWRVRYNACELAICYMHVMSCSPPYLEAAYVLRYLISAMSDDREDVRNKVVIGLQTMHPLLSIDHMYRCMHMYYESALLEERIIIMKQLTTFAQNFPTKQEALPWTTLIQEMGSIHNGSPDDLTMSQVTVEQYNLKCMALALALRQLINHVAIVEDHLHELFSNVSKTLEDQEDKLFQSPLFLSVFTSGTMELLKAENSFCLQVPAILFYVNHIILVDLRSLAFSQTTYSIILEIFLAMTERFVLDDEMTRTVTVDIMLEIIDIAHEFPLIESNKLLVCNVCNAVARNNPLITATVMHDILKLLLPWFLQSASGSSSSSAKSSYTSSMMTAAEKPEIVSKSLEFVRLALINFRAQGIFDELFRFNPDEDLHISELEFFELFHDILADPAVECSMLDPIQDIIHQVFESAMDAAQKPQVLYNVSKYMLKIYKQSIPTMLVNTAVAHFKRLTKQITTSGDSNMLHGILQLSAAMLELNPQDYRTIIVAVKPLFQTAAEKMCVPAEVLGRICAQMTRHDVPERTTFTKMLATSLTAMLRGARFPNGATAPTSILHSYIKMCVADTVQINRLIAGDETKRSHISDHVSMYLPAMLDWLGKPEDSADPERAEAKASASRYLAQQCELVPLLWKQNVICQPPQFARMDNDAKLHVMRSVSWICCEMAASPQPEVLLPLLPDIFALVSAALGVCLQPTSGQAAFTFTAVLYEQTYLAYLIVKIAFFALHELKSAPAVELQYWNEVSVQLEGHITSEIINASRFRPIWRMFLSFVDFIQHMQPYTLAYFHSQLMQLCDNVEEQATDDQVLLDIIGQLREESKQLPPERSSQEHRKLLRTELALSQQITVQFMNAEQSMPFGFQAPQGVIPSSYSSPEYGQQQPSQASSSLYNMPKGGPGGFGRSMGQDSFAPQDPSMSRDNSGFTAAFSQ